LAPDPHSCHSITADAFVVSLWSMFFSCAISSSEKPLSSSSLAARAMVSRSWQSVRPGGVSSSTPRSTASDLFKAITVTPRKRDNREIAAHVVHRDGQARGSCPDARTGGEQTAVGGESFSGTGRVVRTSATLLADDVSHSEPIGSSAAFSRSSWLTE
jgi:hypothetical protein